MTGIWPYIASAAVLVLAVWLTHGLGTLFADLRRIERDLAAERRILETYGTSLSWNDEDRAQPASRPVSATTPVERNGR